MVLLVLLLLPYLDIKGAVGWMGMLRPADQRYPGFIIIAVCKGLTCILWVSNLHS